MDSRQNGQSFRERADSGPSWESVELMGVGVATQLEPVLVHTSVHAELAPRDHASACDSVGASAPNTAISTASHTANERRSKAKCSKGVIS